MDKAGSWFLLAKCLKNTCGRVTFLVKMQVTWIFTKNVTLPQVFFKHFSSKNQLPGFYINGTLVENGLRSNTQRFPIKKANLKILKIFTRKHM